MADAEIQVRRHDGAQRAEEEILQEMRAQGLSPHGWQNAPGYRYDWHEHAYEKILFCVRGGITFHTEAGDIVLRPGDRMVLPAGTAHAATVDSTGVRCVEAPR